jgi:hypothetical protein
MPRITVVRESPDVHSFRASTVKGIFDIPSSETKRFEITVDLPDDDNWNIGLIYGSSGSGKTSIASEVYGAENIMTGLPWNAPCILDDFNKSLDVQEITGALTSVGLSSAPVWLLPYDKLSNGQKFRADMARIILEKDFVVIDEFTSVVDRTVAKSVSVAVHKFIKRTGKKVVVLSCHDDIIEWLQPDWHLNTNTKNLSCALVRRHQIKCNVYECLSKAFHNFRQFHYMSGDINNSARCFLITAIFDGIEKEVGFFSILPVVHRAKKGWRRGHRTVVLPDFQGLGIGNKMIETVAEKLYNEEGLRFSAVTSSPALVQYRRKHADKWILAAAPHMKALNGNKQMKSSVGRLTTSWIFVPTALRKNQTPIK